MSLPLSAPVFWSSDLQHRGLIVKHSRFTLPSRFFWWFGRLILAAAGWLSRLLSL